MFIAGAYFFVYAAQFLSYSLRQKAPVSYTHLTLPTT